MMTIFRRAVVMAMVLPAAAVAQTVPTTFQDHAAIDATATAALSAMGVAAQPVDRRLKLAACPEALAVDAPMHGAVAVRCASRGWRVRVVIAGNTAPALSALGHAAPVVIRRGDPVSVNFVAEGFSVTTSGIAESDARIGERVRVRVEQKTNPVMGEALAGGSVRVGTLN